MTMFDVLNFGMTAASHGTLDPSSWGKISSYHLASLLSGSDESAGTPVGIPCSAV